MRGLAPSIVHTGQHPGLTLAEFGLGGFPARPLRCCGQEDPHRHVGAVTSALLPQLREPPDLLVVQGDTSSALGAALAAFSAEIPVAHVEAGLRTHDPFLPWPEEEYRTAIDANAQLLFAPTSTAAENLRAEAVAGEIHITGNTSIDALLAAEPELPAAPHRTSPTLLVTCHRRESWGEGLTAISAAVAELATDVTVRLVLHPNPHVRGQMQTLLEGISNVHLIDPCAHRDLLTLMREADLVMTDSGGIQEEAPALGIPLLVLREKTERPEGITCGTAILVGTSRDRIVREARRLLNDPEALARMSRRSFPYGDGRAAPRIAMIVDKWLEKRRQLSPKSLTCPRQVRPW